MLIKSQESPPVSYDLFREEPNSVTIPGPKSNTTNLQPVSELLQPPLQETYMPAVEQETAKETSPGPAEPQTISSGRAIRKQKRFSDYIMD